jgi:hypothetical protein
MYAPDREDASSTSHTYSRAPEGTGPRVAEDVRLQGGIRLVVSDVLGTRDLEADVINVDALEEEEAARHPLVGHRPSHHLPGLLPSADQPERRWRRPV